MLEKFIPSMDGMSIKEQAGIAASKGKLSGKRFHGFKSGMEEVKEGGSYHKTDIQKIKGLRKDT